MMEYKGYGKCRSKVLFQYMPEATEENHENIGHDSQCYGQVETSGV